MLDHKTATRLAAKQVAADQRTRRAAHQYAAPDNEGVTLRNARTVLLNRLDAIGRRLAAAAPAAIDQRFELFPSPARGLEGGTHWRTRSKCHERRDDHP